jgi:hypothetical protein
MPASELDSSVTVPKLLSLSAVSEALAVSPHTVRMWVRKRRLIPLRLCRRLLFHPQEITRFLNQPDHSAEIVLRDESSL